MAVVSPATVKNHAMFVAAALRCASIHSSSGMSKASGIPPTRTETQRRRATANRPNKSASEKVRIEPVRGPLLPGRRGEVMEQSLSPGATDSLKAGSGLPLCGDVGAEACAKMEA